MNDAIKKLWRPYFHYDWKSGVFLILLFGIPRFIIVLQSYVNKSYGTVAWIFVGMWLLPFVLLTKAGRKDIGLRSPSPWWRTGLSFAAGGVACFLLFEAFAGLYGSSLENPFVYIGGNNPTNGIAGNDKFIYFLIAAVPSMLFSPIGEEFLYRGVIHGCFAGRFGQTKASFFDSAAFALTHLAHFGIVYTAAAWRFLPLPSLLWMLSMFLVSQLFFRSKRYCHSLWGAVAAHAGFNLVMMYGIFYGF